MTGIPAGNSHPDRVTRRQPGASSTLMPNRRIANSLILVLSLTTIAGGGLAWSQYLRSVRLGAELLQGGARTDLEKRLQASEKRRNQLEAEVADLRARASRSAGPEGGPEAAPTPEGNRGPGRFFRQGRASFLSGLMDDPKFNKLWTDQQKARIAAAFNPLCRSLNLTPDQTAQFQSLLAERQMTLMDAVSAARAEGIYGRDAIAGVVKDATAQIDGQLQSLLGPDGYSQYQNFVGTQPQRTQVNELQLALLSAGSSPLQDYQVQQLTQILAQNGATAGGIGGRGGNVMFGELGGGLGVVLGTPVTGPPITEQAVSQATTVLSPAQLQVLQQLQQQQATQRQIFELMRQGAGPPPGGATTPTASAPGAVTQPVSAPVPPRG